MPKVVDHEQRRERIADAVCRLVARGGFEQVSLRHVAVEAGVSVGQLQHYFASKDEMLLSAFHTVSARVERRLEAAGRELGGPDTRALVRMLMLAMVSAGDESREEAPLWLAFIARAAVEPRLAEPLRAGTSMMLRFAADQLRAAQDSGAVARSLDPDREADGLFALADGLMVRTLLDPSATDDAVACVDYHLDRIFAGGSHPPPAEGAASGPSSR